MRHRSQLRKCGAWPTTCLVLLTLHILEPFIPVPTAQMSTIRVNVPQPRPATSRGAQERDAGSGHVDSLEGDEHKER